MANNFSDSELIKQGSVRAFYQPGGPGRAAYFYGVDTEYFFIGGAQLPIQGDINPIFVPDPRRPNRYRLVGRTIDAPDLASVDLTFLEKWGGIPRVLMAPKCNFNLYEVHSDCSDLSDFYRGWRGYMLIYSLFQFSGAADLGTRMQRDGNDPLEISASAMGMAIYPVGALSFGEEAAADVVVEVMDAVYGTAIQCGSCGLTNDGSAVIYAITRANVGSPSAPGQLIYSTDGGTTWATATITGIGSSSDPLYIDIAGDMLFLGTATTRYYSRLNADTGAPTTWNSVAQAATDVYVANPNAIYSVSGTAINRTRDVTLPGSTVGTASGGTLVRIHGDGETTIVAVGGSHLVRSINDGLTWSELNVPSSGLLAVQVISANELWVADTSAIYHTTNGGATWDTVIDLDATTINDLVFVTPEVAWCSYEAGGVARLATTLDGGQSWTTDAATSRIISWPVFQRARRLASPVLADPAIAANYVTVCGLAASGADGILLNAAPTIL